MSRALFLALVMPCVALTQAAKAERDGHYRHARDYQTSLQWYEKARTQGARIPKPPAFTKGH